MKNNWKHNQKMRKEANAIIEKGLLEMGATKVPDSIYKWEYPAFVLATKLGMLTIRLESIDDDHQSKCYSVFSRFEESENYMKEIESINGNKFSGKWNWVEWVEGVEPERFANMILFHIGKVKL